MRNVAIEYPKAREIAFVDLDPAPDPGRDDIIIRTRYSGVTNGTERHALLGEHGWKGAFPSRHGYQCVGRIDKAGSNVTAFKEGDMVFYGQYVGHRAWHKVDVSDPRGSHLTFTLPDGIDLKSCGLMGVAGVALFLALLTQAEGRLAQLAPLWAVGVRRSRLMQLNAAQAWLLAGLTLLLALPLGIVLAWCLVAVINVQAFGWRLPLQVFPTQLLELAGWAVLATLLASAWPLWKLWRSRPVELLGVFANER